MAKLAAWSVGRQTAEGDPRPSKPTRVKTSRIGLEKHLEDWIVDDVGLIGDGLTLVGRQVRIDDGILDLLALDTRERWVVIEVKPDMLDAGALTQALRYASSLAHIEAGELRERLEPGLGKLGDARQLSERLDRQLEGEGDTRDIAMLLVGAGVYPGLERVNGLLGGFGVPIGIVSFEVFELDGGPQLLVREIVDEKAGSPKPPRFTVEAVRRHAVDAGVGRQFDRFVNSARAAGLPVQPHKFSVRIAPPANRTRMLMFACPETGDDGGRLHFEISMDCFREFFPEIDQQKTAKALSGLNRVSLGGSDLDEALDKIGQFLKDTFPGVGADAG